MDNFNNEVDQYVLEKTKIFLDKLGSEMHFDSDYSGDLMAFDWVDEIEKACPFIDIIVRRPKIALIREENTVKVEKAKKITVASVKDLSKHTNYINKVDKKTDSVEPKKILDVRNEETFNIYENRFLFTLINDLEKFVAKKEKLLDDFELCDEKTLEYAATTLTDTEKVNIEVKVTSESLPTNKIDKNLKEELKKIKLRLKRIKEYIGSWQKSEMYKALVKAKVGFINPPVKKTNITLKNPNFRIAVKLWEYILRYDYDNEEESKDNLEDNGNDVLKGFIDHAFLIDYFVMDSLVTSKREQKKKMAKCAITLLTEEIRRIVSLLLSCGYEITDEQLLNIIAKEIKRSKSERLVGQDDVKNKFKKVLDEYLERTQEYTQ